MNTTGRRAHKRFHFRNIAAVLTISAIIAIGLPACSGDNRTVEEHFEAAKAYRAKGDLRASVIELKNVLQRSPNHAEARLMLGLIYIVAGDGEGAEKELRRAGELGLVDAEQVTALGKSLILQGKFDAAEKVLVLDDGLPQNVRASRLVLRADALLAQRKTADARKALQEAQRLSPDSYEAIAGFARLALLRNDLDEANEKIDRALALNGAYQEGWRLKGEIAFARQNYTEAEQAFRKAIEHDAGISERTAFNARAGLAKSLLAQSNYKDAQVVVEHLLAVAPKHPLPNYLRGLIAYREGQLDTAKTYLNEVVATAPNHKPSLLLLGAVDYAQGQLEQAEMYLSNVVLSQPSNASARKLLGATRLKLRKPAEAMEALKPMLSTSEDDAQLLAMVGDAAVKSGDTAKAIEYLKKAADASPSNESIRVHLAQLYLAEGNIDEAIAVLKTGGGDSDEHLYSSRLLLTITYLRSRDFAKAEEVAQALVADFDDDPVTHNLVGNVLALKGDVTAARAAFDKALRLKGDFLPALFSLARLNVAAGDIDGAVANYEKIIALDSKNISAMIAAANLAARQGRKDDAEKWLERAQNVAPQALQPFLALTSYYLRVGSIDKAAANIGEAEKIAPDNPSVLALRGEVELKAGKKQDAVKTFERLVRTQPKSAQARTALARARMVNKDKEGAREALKKALDIQPDDPLATSLLANLEVREGNTDKALALANGLRKRQPRSSVGYVIEGDVHFAQKQYKDAFAAYNRGMEKAADQSLVAKLYKTGRLAGRDNPHQVLERWLKDHNDDVPIRILLATYYQEKGRLDAAANQYEDVIRAAPENVVALNNLAWLYAEKGDPRAPSLAEKAYNLRPTDGGIADTLGWILVQNGDAKRGLELLKQAEKTLPTIPDIQFHVAVALAESGQNDLARKKLIHLLDSGKAFAGKDSAKALLNRLKAKSKQDES